MSSLSSSLNFLGEYLSTHSPLSAFLAASVDPPVSVLTTGSTMRPSLMRRSRSASRSAISTGSAVRPSLTRRWRSASRSDSFSASACLASSILSSMCSIDSESRLGALVPTGTDALASAAVMGSTAAFMSAGAGSRRTNTRRPSAVVTGTATPSTAAASSAGASSRALLGSGARSGAT